MIGRHAGINGVECLSQRLSGGNGKSRMKKHSKQGRMASKTYLAKSLRVLA